jgi:hypothetical protein
VNPRKIGEPEKDNVLSFDWKSNKIVKHTRLHSVTTELKHRKL